MAEFMRMNALKFYPTFLRRCEMKNKILEILYDAGIKNTGFCDYALIKEHLLPCRAISRIPEKASSVIICAFPYKVKEQRADKISR